MRALTVFDIVRVWELGEGKPSWYRALLLLAPALPDLKPEELAALSLGQRNALLLQLREELIGRTMEAFVKCPACRDALEFQIDTREFGGFPTPGETMQRQVEVNGFVVTYRLWNSTDAAQASSGEKYDRLRMAEGCILEARATAAGAVAIEHAPERESILAALGEELARVDPLGDLKLTLACANCGHQWPAFLDIAAFLWSELKRRAESLLEDVHVLASAYGWSEADVFAMTPTRRRFFMEKLA